MVHGHMVNRVHGKVHGHMVNRVHGHMVSMKRGEPLNGAWAYGNPPPDPPHISMKRGEPLSRRSISRVDPCWKVVNTAVNKRAYSFSVKVPLDRGACSR